MGDLSREPSMEEILSSIRRVIARDEPAGIAVPRHDPAEPVDAADEAADEDVLELTVASVEPTSEPQPEDDTAMATDARTPNRKAKPEAQLISPDSAAASRHSLDALAALVASDAQPEAVAAPGGDISVNALVQAALRPMLKQWLDANLPAIVEELVAKEIQRIASHRD
jgi:hypothetical protein